MKDFFQSDFERFISKIFSSSVVRTEMVLKTCTSFTVISIFLRLIVLQTMSPTEYIDSPTVRVDIPTSLFSFFFPYKPLVLVNSRTVDMVFKSNVLLVLLPVGLRYGGQEQCVVSAIFCRAINTAVKTSVSLVLQHTALEYRIDSPILSRANDF